MTKRWGPMKHTVCQGTCGRPIHRHGTPVDDQEPGSIKHAAKWMCSTCYRNRYLKESEGAAVPMETLPEGIRKMILRRRARGIPEEGIRYGSGLILEGAE